MRLTIGEGVCVQGGGGRAPMEAKLSIKGINGDVLGARVSIFLAPLKLH